MHSQWAALPALALAKTRTTLIGMANEWATLLLRWWQKNGTAVKFGTSRSKLGKVWNAPVPNIFWFTQLGNVWNGAVPNFSKLGKVWNGTIPSTLERSQPAMMHDLPIA